MPNVCLAFLMFHVRLSLTALFNVSINVQARGFANITYHAAKTLKKKYNYTLWDRILMLDVYNHAKVNGLWVCIFFYENIIMLVCYTIANIFATVWEVLYGQTTIMGYSLIGMYGLLSAHWILFCIPNELFNYDWREKRHSGRKKKSRRRF